MANYQKLLVIVLLLACFVATIATLKRKAAAWKKRMNQKKVKIDWKFSRRKARVKFKYKTGKN